MIVVLKTVDIRTPRKREDSSLAEVTFVLRFESFKSFSVNSIYFYMVTDKIGIHLF